MRILVISNFFPPIAVGGYEIECAAVVDRLREKHDVTVLASEVRREEAPAGDYVVRELALLPRSWRGTVRAPRQALRAARTVRRLLTETDPDLIYVWNGAQLPGSALRIALDSGRPVAFRLCEAWFGSMFSGPSGDQFLRHLVPGQTGARRLLLDPAMRLVNRHPELRLDAARRSPAAVCWNAHALKEHTGVPPVVEPVVERVIHSIAARGPLFDAAPRVPRPEGSPPLIAFVGRLDRAKGGDIAIRALARLRAHPELGEARLVMAGPIDEAFRPELERARAGLPGEAVELLGPQPAEAVVDLLSRADAFCVPSNWFEPFPHVLIEGAFARVPMVAAAVGGIPECFQDPEHILLFGQDDDAGCAAALERVLTDREAAQRRVDAAHARAHAEFGVDAYLAATERFIDEAVAALR